MRCPRCDANVSEGATRCTFCGQDLSIVHYAKRVSNTYYNMGLEKARVRDLTGAIGILKKSLEFDKKNTNARNLLGLVYYEMGETVAALSEWILSKYLQPDKNDADYYIRTLQNNQTALDATNQTIKKYNSALVAAKSGSEDLAIIQLKKVCSLNPHFVRAHQLLALLYIHAEDYQRATKCLQRARRIDFNNTTTLRYMQEVGDKMSRSVTTAPKKTPKKDPLANVTPVGTYKEEKRNFMPIVYGILGVILGIAITFGLIRPTLLKNNNDDGQEISSVNEKMAVQESQISGLQKDKEDLTLQIDVLKKQIEDSDTQAQQRMVAYEKLVNGLHYYYMEDDKVKAALTVGDCKKSDFNTVAAKDLYGKICNLTDSEIAALVSQGRSTMNTSYEGAINIFEQVLSVQEDNQEAMYCIGRCYQLLGKNKKAKNWYEKAIEIATDSAIATEAKGHLEEVKEALGESGASEDTAQGENTPAE